MRERPPSVVLFLLLNRHRRLSSLVVMFCTTATEMLRDLKRSKKWLPPYHVSRVGVQERVHGGAERIRRNLCV